jgi:broad specificity phosphatase PhoE
VPHYRDSGDFERAVARLFTRPNELVFGRETAADAEHRFAAAVEDVLARNADGNVVVVAHGTVISLFVARHTSLDPYEYWRLLGMPAFAVMSVPDLTLLNTVARVD